MKDEALKKEDEALNTEQEAGTEQTSEAGSGEAGNTEAAAEAGETAEDVPEGAEEDTEQAPAAEKEEKKGFFKKKKDPRDEKIEDLTDRVKRQMAEFENFRKRTDKEKSARQPCLRMQREHPLQRVWRRYISSSGKHWRKPA